MEINAASTIIFEDTLTLQFVCELALDWVTRSFSLNNVSSAQWCNEFDTAMEMTH
jgi:hypothetical protein